MPAFCAAFRSFHPKSSVMYFVRDLTSVRVLSFLFLTFTLTRSSTLTVSTFGVRSYSDQRDWSIQTRPARGTHPELRCLRSAGRRSAHDQSDSPPRTARVALAAASEEGGTKGAAARVARQEDSRSWGAIGVLRFSRRLVLVMICFGGVVPVRSIRCQPVFVIFRFRCRARA